MDEKTQAAFYHVRAYSPVNDMVLSDLNDSLQKWLNLPTLEPELGVPSLAYVGLRLRNEESIKLTCCFRELPQNYCATLVFTRCDGTEGVNDQKSMYTLVHGPILI